MKFCVRISTTFNIQEKNKELRRTFYEFYQIIRLKNSSLLLEINHSLSSNIRNYPEDAYEIYVCAAKLGIMYHSFIKKNIFILLGHEPHFLVREKDRDDPVHIFNIIQISNALSQSEPVDSSKLPFYFLTHEDYIHHQYPNLIPKTPPIIPSSELSYKSGSWKEYFENTIEFALGEILQGKKLSKIAPVPQSKDLDENMQRSFFEILKILRDNQRIFRIISKDPVCLWPRKIISHYCKTLMQRCIIFRSLHKKLSREWKLVLFEIYLRCVLLLECKEGKVGTSFIVAKLSEALPSIKQTEATCIIRSLIEASNTKIAVQSYLIKTPILKIKPKAVDLLEARRINAQLSLSRRLTPSILAFDYHYPINLLFSLDISFPCTNYTIGFCTPDSLDSPNEGRHFQLKKGEKTAHINLKERKWEESAKVSFAIYKKALPLFLQLASSQESISSHIRISEPVSISIWPKQFLPQNEISLTVIHIPIIWI